MITWNDYVVNEICLKLVPADGVV